jgi:hypothetical protein
VFAWTLASWAVASLGGAEPSITRPDDIVGGLLKYFSGSVLNFSAQPAQQK